MKLLNHLYCSTEELELFIENNQILSYRESVLIQLFSSVIDKVFLEEVSALIHRLLPQATLIGATTAGEIADGLMLEKETLLSFSLFDNITIKSCAFLGLNLQYSFLAKSNTSELGKPSKENPCRRVWSLKF